MEKKPRVTDAKFKVIEPPAGYVRNKWWQGWSIDWRGVAIVFATSLAALIHSLMQ